jgi:hypothetical protein
MSEILSFGRGAENLSLVQDDAPAEIGLYDPSTAVKGVIHGLGGQARRRGEDDKCRGRNTSRVLSVSRKRAESFTGILSLKASASH